MSSSIINHAALGNKSAGLGSPGRRVCAVVPAAGTGTRMGGHTGEPKQYVEVLGVPLVAHCLRGLEAAPWIDEVVVVADSKSKMTKALEKAKLKKTRIVEGGGTRHRSIWVGVEALADDPPELLVVMDGVRPLVPMDMLEEVVLAAEEAGAAGPVLPLVSTVVLPDKDQHLQETLVRSNYWNTEMPQAFRYHTLKTAYHKCSDHELDNGTECLAVVKDHCGVKPKLVRGTGDLWKVTYPKDLVVARVLLPRHLSTLAIVASTEEAHHKSLQHESLNNSHNSDCDPDNTLDAIVSMSDYLRESSQKEFKKILQIQNLEGNDIQNMIHISPFISISNLMTTISTVKSRIDSNISSLIFILSSSQNRTNVNNSLNVVNIQKDVRDLFSDGSCSVSVFLCLSIDENSVLRLSSMVKALLNDPKCFHGQVLIV
ncbi:unnamed protein product, partial [Meganyctiphanes norvegica]